MFLPCAGERDDAEQGQPKLDDGASSEAEERFDGITDMVGFDRVNKETLKAWQDSATQL